MFFIGTYNYNLDDKNRLTMPSKLREQLGGKVYVTLGLDKCLAIYRCKTRDEAIDSYAKYFDLMYGGNLKFTNAIDEIYNKYKRGEDVYLGCFCPKSVRCHGDIIIEKLQKRLIKEKLKERKIILKNDTI